MRLFEMTWPEVRALDKANVLLLWPLAAVEQHGPHLPTGTDTILVTGVADRVEAALPEAVLLLPTLYCWAERDRVSGGEPIVSTSSQGHA